MQQEIKKHFPAFTSSLEVLGKKYLSRNQFPDAFVPRSLTKDWSDDRDDPVAGANKVIKPWKNIAEADEFIN